MTHASGRTLAVAAGLGVVHGLIDLSSAFVLFRDLAFAPLSDSAVALWIGAYDILAFAGQVPLGLVADRYGLHRQASLAGVVLTVAALLLAPAASLVATVFVGIGNALFHLGAGAFVLSTSGTRAREIGLFLGPGAVGLTLGIVAGPSSLPLRIPLLLALIAAAFFVWLFVAPVATSSSEPSLRRTSTTVRIGLGLVLLTVAARALLGDTLAAAAREHSTTLVVALACAACIGKCTGGFASERFGWGTTSLAALVVAAPLLAAASAHPLCVLVGAVLLQATAALTAKAVHAAMPSRPGLAFGLPSAALLLGAAPGLSGLGAISSAAPALAVALASALTFLSGLWLLRGAGDSIPRRSGLRGVVISSPVEGAFRVREASSTRALISAPDVPLPSREESGARRQPWPRVSFFARRR